MSIGGAGTQAPGSGEPPVTPALEQLFPQVERAIPRRRALLLGLFLLGLWGLLATTAGAARADEGPSGQSCDLVQVDTGTAVPEVTSSGGSVESDLSDSSGEDGPAPAVTACFPSEPAPEAVPVPPEGTDDDPLGPVPAEAEPAPPPDTAAPTVTDAVAVVEPMVAEPTAETPAGAADVVAVETAPVDPVPAEAAATEPAPADTGSDLTRTAVTEPLAETTAVTDPCLVPVAETTDGVRSGTALRTTAAGRDTGADDATIVDETGPPPTVTPSGRTTGMPGPLPPSLPAPAPAPASPAGPASVTTSGTSFFGQGQYDHHVDAAYAVIDAELTASRARGSVSPTAGFAGPVIGGADDPGVRPG